MFVVMQSGVRAQKLEAVMRVLARLCTCEKKVCDCAQPVWGPRNIVLTLTDGLSSIDELDVQKLKKLAGVVRVDEGSDWPLEAGSARPQSRNDEVPSMMTIPL